MSKLDLTQAEELKSKYHDVYEVPIGDVIIYIKPVGRKKNSEIQNTVSEMQRGKSTEVEINQKVEDMIIQDCVLSPTGDALAALLESRAGVAPSIVEQIYTISGFLVMDAPKKL